MAQQHNELVISTDNYYDENATEYFYRTVGADLSHLYDRFLVMLPKDGRILDAGCGSGRDLRVFVQRGFRATGIDASQALVNIAKSYSGAPCMVGRIEDIEYESYFDGIWACASLLHLPKEQLNLVLRRMRKALVPGGAMFMSVQEGEGERLMDDGRFFAFYQPAELLGAIESAGFSIENAWSSDDVLQKRATIRWINVLARSTKSPTIKIDG